MEIVELNIAQWKNWNVWRKNRYYEGRPWVTLNQNIGSTKKQEKMEIVELNIAQWKIWNVWRKNRYYEGDLVQLDQP